MMWVLSTMLKAVTVTLVMVLAALNEVKVPLLRVSQAEWPGPPQAEPLPIVGVETVLVRCGGRSR